MTAFLQGIIDAATAGSFYALFALGIALIFGIMRLVNFAHGELIMIGAYTIYLVQDLFWPAIIIITAIVVVLAALIMERVAFRPVRGANPATLLITSFAVSFLLQNIARLVFTSLPKSVDISPLFRQSVRIGGVTVTWLSVITLATTLLLLLMLAIFLSRTRLGLQMRAAAEDFRMARLCGVPADRVIAAAFVLSGVLATAAAVLVAAQTGSLTVGMGLTPVLFGFTAAVIGGLGSLPGAVTGGYLLGAATGVLNQTLPLTLAGYRDALLFAGVFAFMALRPGGLLQPEQFEELP